MNGGTIRARSKAPAGFDTIMRTVAAEPYRGRRVRFAGDMSADAVTGRAVLWMRIEDEADDVIAFDGMQGRDIVGTHPFSRCEVVLDVPERAARIRMGYLLEGGGGITARDVGLEVVTHEVATTGHTWEGGWCAVGSAPYAYDMKLDPSRAGGTIRARSDTPPGFGGFTRTVPAEPYRGRRVRLRGRLSAECVTGTAGLWLRADDASRRVIAFENLRDRHVVGTQPLRRHEVVLDIPEAAALIHFGCILDGGGAIRAEQMELDVVGEEAARDGATR